MRRPSLLSGLVACSLVAAAPAIPTPDETPPPSDLSVRIVDVPDHGTLELDLRPDLRTLLTQDVDPHDPTTVLDVVARHVGELWGTSLVRIDDEPPAEPEPEPEPAPPSTIGGQLDHADLDGDGRDDVLVGVYDDATGTPQLLALSGLDGRELWRVGHDGSGIAWPAGDLTGDGASDLFVFTLRFGEITAEDTCDDDGCRGRVHADWTWELGVRAGTTGALAWTEAGAGGVDYEYDESYPDGGYAYSDRIEFAGFGGYPYPGGDHDGDGGRDLLVNLLDLTEARSWSHSAATPVTDERRETHEFESVTTASVLRGADGTSLHGPLTATGPDLALLERAGDATGDGTEDLLWQRFEVVEDDAVDCTGVLFVDVCRDPDDGDGRTTVTIELLDGRSLTTAWSSSHDVDPFWGGGARPALADLDGVAGDDLLVRALPPRADDDALPLLGADDGDPFADASELHLLSGPDGATVWRVDAPDGALQAVADLGGGPAADLLYESVLLSGSTMCSDDECQYSADLTHAVVRLDGTDGTVLSDTSRTWDLGDGELDWFWFAFPGTPGDHDGDGVVDLVVNGGTNNVGVAAVQSARSGALLFEDVHDGDHPVVVTSTLGDLDGNGSDELSTRRGWCCDLVVRSMPDGDVLHEFDGFDHPSAGGDHDGLPGDELVRSFAEVEGDVGRVYVASLDGLTLEPRWTVEVDRFEHGESTPHAG